MLKKYYYIVRIEPDVAVMHIRKDIFYDEKKTVDEDMEMLKRTTPKAKYIIEEKTREVEEKKKEKDEKFEKFGAATKPITRQYKED